MEVTRPRRFTGTVGRGNRWVGSERELYSPPTRCQLTNRVFSWRVSNGKGASGGRDTFGEFLGACWRIALSCYNYEYVNERAETP